MDDGGAAFPAPGFNLEQRVGNHGWLDAQDLHRGPLERGMSLRDWFAGMALQGMYASRLSGQFDLYLTAHECYRAADAMLAEKNKNK